MHQTALESISNRAGNSWDATSKWSDIDGRLPKERATKYRISEKRLLLAPIQTLRRTPRLKTQNYQLMKRYNFALALVLAFGMMFAVGCKDACEKDDPCINGTCADVDGEAVCTCDTGYEGTNCDTEMRDKFEGTWQYTDACDGTTLTTTTFGEVGSNVSQISIEDVLGSLGGTATATVTGSSIMLESQTVVANSGDSYTVTSTSGTLANGSFSWTVTLSGLLNESCVQTYNKQ